MQEMRSLPPWGAWIEMPDGGGFLRADHQSLPPRGAWIEIFCTRWNGPYTRVAPPTGSVD